MESHPKHKPLTNHVLVAYYNAEGHGHMLLDFHAPTKVEASLTDKMREFASIYLGGEIIGI